MKRTQKVIGPGGTVNLTSFFRKVWVKDGEPILPLTIEPLPTYSWPTNAPISIVATFSDWILDIDGIGEVNYPDQILSSTFRGSDSLSLGDTGEGQLESALTEYIERTKNYQKLILARMSQVILRWASND